MAGTTKASRRLGLDDAVSATSLFSSHRGGPPFLFAKRKHESSIALSITVDGARAGVRVTYALSDG